MIGNLLERNPRLANWLYGFTPPEPGTVVLVHRRVYIVPARLGWIFGGVLGVLLIGSINYALSLGFALTFLLAALGLTGMVHTARNLARIAITAGRAEPVFAGESAQFRLYLDGRGAFDRPSILARHLRSGSQLVLGVIEVESAFRKYAVSRAGARGYMQVMPFWVNLIGQPGHNLFHLRTNLAYGCAILRHYLDIEKGDYFRALGRYNGSLGKAEYPNLVLSAWRGRWKYDGPTA